MCVFGGGGAYAKFYIKRNGQKYWAPPPPLNPILMILPVGTTLQADLSPMLQSLPQTPCHCGLCLIDQVSKGTTQPVRALLLRKWSLITGGGGGSFRIKYDSQNNYCGNFLVSSNISINMCIKMHIWEN